MGSESIAHEAEGHEDERNCFSKIQPVVKNIEKTILASKCDSTAIVLVFKAAASRFSLLVGYNI